MNQNKKNPTINFIKESHERHQQQRKHFTFFGDIDVFILDELPENVNLQDCLEKIQYLIPNHLLHDVDAIYIGNINHFQDNDTNAAYLDGAIYICNIQDDNEDFVDDIIHEIAHATEKTYGSYLYHDNKLELEFLGKRTKLEAILRHSGYDTEKFNFHTPDYSKDLDAFLYSEVGYVDLNNYSRGLFASAYGATSLREYYANGLEEYYLGDRKYLKKISPVLFEKLEFLNYNEEPYTTTI